VKRRNAAASRSILPNLTDLIFVCISAYLVLNYVRTILVSAQSSIPWIRDAFYLTYLLIALALLAIRNRANAFTARRIEYAYTIIGFCAPLLFQPAPSIGPLLVAGSLEVAGLLLVVAAFLSLNRSFGLAPENRGIKTNGAYGIVRHPMYLGYLLAEAGFVFDNFSSYNLIIFSISALFLVLRLRAEERLLQTDTAYRKYAKKVRWRLLPMVY